MEYTNRFSLLTLARPKHRAFRLVTRRCLGDSNVMQLQIEYPDSLPDLLQTTRPQFEAEARMAMAVKLV